MQFNRNGNGNGNRLVSNYNNSYQQNNNGYYKNNNLLKSNPFLNPNLQQQQMLKIQQQQMMQMQQMQMQQMQKIKEMQQIRQMTKLNEVELTMDKEKIKESIIRPIKIEKNKQDRIKLEREWKEAENVYHDKTGKNYGSEIKKYWSKRTNQPYKNIMKNEDYTKKIKSTKDLIVHRVTDKDKEGVEEEYVDLKGKLEMHNNELKVIYSTSTKNEHKKKFEYNHVYKYRVKHNAKDHTDHKQDKIAYYKKQQKKEEVGKKKLDILLDTLVSDGIFDKDELSGLSFGNSNSNKKSNDNSSQDSNTSNTSNRSNRSSASSTSSKKEKYLQRRRNKK
jgi:hypothetical protein